MPMIAARFSLWAKGFLWRVVIGYAVFAGVWIVGFDYLLALWFDDAQGMQAANTLKGLIFVAVTSLLLFFLLLRVATALPEDTASKNAALPPLYGDRHKSRVAG